MAYLPLNSIFCKKLNSLSKSTKKVVLEKFPQILEKKIVGRELQGTQKSKKLDLAPLNIPL